MAEFRKEVDNFYTDLILSNMGSKNLPKVAGGVGYFNQAMRKKMDEYKRVTVELIYGDPNIPYWQKSLFTDQIERDLK